MAIGEREWESVYAAIKAAQAPDEFIEGIVVDHDADGRHVYLTELGAEPIPMAGLDYEHTIYAGSLKQKIRSEPVLPAIGDRVLVARTGGSRHRPRVVGVIRNNEKDWKQPSDIQVPTLAGFLSAVYPIGCIYTSVVPTNPATLFGFGTWVEFGAGRVPVGFDAGQTEFDTVEETGGAKTHTLAETEIPAHDHDIVDNGHQHGIDSDGDHFHQISYSQNSNTTITGGGDRIVSINAAGSGPNQRATTTEGAHDHGGVTDPIGTGIDVLDAGGGQAHNNLQPFIVVHMWKRTA